MKRWYAVQTQPRREALAELHLRKQQFAVFCPKVKRARKMRDGMRVSLTPFFPSYLFVEVDLERDGWRSINGTLGVNRIVSFGAGREAMPAAMPDGLVEHFIASSQANGEISFAEEIAAGDAVRIIGGPFDGLCGILEKAPEGSRVMILLEFLSRHTRVKVERERLIRA